MYINIINVIMFNNQVIAFFNRQMENLVHGQLILLLWCTTLLPIKLVGKTSILQGLDCIFCMSPPLSGRDI